MRADIEQDVDGKVWLLVDGPDGTTYRISHEAVTAPPVFPPIKFPRPESVKWPGPGAGYWSTGTYVPRPLLPEELWKASII
jgi:hypothetical protein